MGILEKVGTIIVSKLNRILERVEDPRETLDYSYEEQVTMLKAVKRGLVDVVASKNQLISKRNDLNRGIDKFEEQAKSAVKASRDDLAQAALEKKHTLVAQIAEMNAGIETLQHEEDALTKTEKDIERKLDAFKCKKEVLKAQYTAAESISKINESVTGLSEGFTDIGSAVERIEDKTSQMKSRATAIDNLVESGVLHNVLGEQKSAVENELDKVNLEAAVKDDLERLKKESAAYSPMV